ncbi:uncharacterized protein LOC114260924 [Camellia sinensis]|uniref:Uncharacterized protein n=1 Tax=Camellia sinensis var. sinensis TaxID=542762 RepID=A0A4S4EU12_CAMSN|nr:uncharacterized protein LOC114260924 [Camellia sinensis]THG19935.1 hypothetical protein TEA_021556 [Camellia sinensis var. sinensis]
MDLWLWLEVKRFPNIIAKLLNRSDFILNVMADEATTCLQVLESKTAFSSPSGSTMSVTAKIIGKPISVPMITHINFTAIIKIKTFLNNVCSLIFTDILQQVLGSLNQPLPVMSFPHLIFRNITVISLPLSHHLPTEGLWGWSHEIKVLVDDRAMFLTFSRGYPVSESEVKELFTGCFCDCVDNVDMDESNSVDQPLFARMIVRGVSIVDDILKGSDIAKF